MCEFCPVDGGECCVCDAHLAEFEPEFSVPPNDPFLLISRDGRLSARRGEDHRDNPHPPGTFAYFIFGGAQADERYS